MKTTLTRYANTNIKVKQPGQHVWSPMLLECEFDVLPELGPKTPDSTQHEAQTTKSQVYGAKCFLDRKGRLAEKESNESNTEHLQTPTCLCPRSM